jgi:hypothetical protein
MLRDGGNALESTNVSIGLPLVHAAIKKPAGAAAEDAGYRSLLGIEVRQKEVWHLANALRYKALPTPADASH